MNRSRHKPVLAGWSLPIVGIVLWVPIAIAAPLNPSELVALHQLATLAAAMGTYINPPPAVDPLPDATHPAAGVVGDNLGSGGGTRQYCSGSLLESNILASSSFALTAGHCVGIPAGVPAVGDVNGRFWVSGPTGALQSSDRVRRHPDYGFPSNDIALMRLTTSVAGVTPYSLRRTAVSAGDPFTSVGFGHTGYNGVTNTGFPTKREAAFTLGALGAGGPAGPNDYSFATGAAPLRHLCQGDSGGPSLFGGVIGGVHSYVASPICDGNNTSNGDANVTQPFLYNWIDSYSRRANFWDNIHIYRTPAGAAAPPSPVPLPPGWMEILPADSLEPGVGGYGRGLTGYPPAAGAPLGWETGGSAPHPTLMSPGAPAGMVNGAGSNNRYRYFNAIGVDNAGAAELFVGGAGSVSGLGVVMLTGEADYISKYFGTAPSSTVAYQICAYVEQRWNSLSIGADVGLLNDVALSVSWGGLSYATPAGALAVDTWRWRNVCIPVAADTTPPIVFKLLTVPEPASALLLLCGLSFLGRRTRC